MAFAGDGGPPPPKGSGFNSNDAMYGFDEVVTKEIKGERKTLPKRVKLWYLPPGAKDKPATALDRKGDRYTLLIHEFVGPDGKTKPKCMVRCIARANLEKGCPLCDALGKEGRWFWALTAIDGSRFTPSEGQNKGNVYSNFRRLVLVTSQEFENMKAIEEKDKDAGWRGRRFDVTRSVDTKSAKIGTTWYPKTPPKVSDEEMIAEFEEAAGVYGLPVEQYIEPLDYSVVCKAPSHEEALKIAAAIKGTAPGGAEVPAGDTESIVF